MKRIILICITSTFLFACDKQEEWLDVKSNKADAVPGTLKDLQAILDNDQVMNERYSWMGAVGADNYYITDAVWDMLPMSQERNAYIWNKDIYEGEPGNDWMYLYQKIEYANIVLDKLDDIEVRPAEQGQRNTIRGSALFYRAYSFYILAQLFAKPYTWNSGVNDLGIPLRLSSDINKRTERAGLIETYQQIERDLKEAETLLPVSVAFKTRPSKLAAQSLLARLYLNTGDYTRAHDYANSALTSKSDLLDFNALNAAATYPLPTMQQDNKEIIFYSIFSSTSLGSTRLMVSPELYNSYQTDDLRKSIFFRSSANGINFRGYYTGVASEHFAGMATNELVLIRAEAAARQGNKDGALADLNMLLEKRWKRGTFVPVTAADAEEVLVKVLEERRKELPYTGTLRWEDLRRLNKEQRFGKILTRTVKGIAYTLEANDKRFVYPIPDEEILLSGIEQNLR